MKIAAAELRRRIEQGEDLEAISLSLISRAEQGLLRCCAVVSTFDEKLVDDYFRPHVPGADKESVPFSALTSHDFVHRVPRTDGVYYLQPATQKKYYDEWWRSYSRATHFLSSEVPTALRELSVQLVEHYAALGDEGKLDLLRQMVFVDKGKAHDLFEELYKAADTAFDLARCNDLINVLTGLEDLLGPTRATLLNDTRRYLKSRSLWATEYYQTVSYYDRKELSSEFESFLAGNAKPDGEKKWILHLHAPGGMGKTMFVRWLIARRCVPRPDTIPCGRVDFDFVNRITASQHRWLLFLEIADELEKQIPGNFFHSLIGKFTDYERVLNHQQSQQSTTSTTSQLPPREKLEEEMLYLFGNALRDANLNEPIVLIFDTLEEVILYHPENLLEIVRQVNKLREAFPNVLLILSGRYDLTETGSDAATTRLPQFNAEFGAVTQTLRVKPFSDEEALGFLQLRGLTKDRPLEIVVKKSEGNPFKLALFADILLDDPEITADTIRSYPSADLLYLIERVLARIANKKLHWLLRYGVVPRKLTRSFVEDVMMKHLARAISGDDQLDDPSRYQYLTPKVHAKVREKEIFVKAPVQDLDVDQLWKDLQNYASKFAWVTMDASDPNIASFHGDVVNPMRRWLEEEPVYKLLHQDAIAYFEKKAQEDSKNWGQWMSNALYHKFQLEGDQAAEYWFQLIDHGDDPAQRHELASEVVGSEYADELKPRLLLGGQEIISTATLARAYFELARASVDMANVRNAPAGDQLWSDAENDLQTCERLQRELPEPIVSPAAIAIVRSALLTSQGHSDQAISIVEEALKEEWNELTHLSLQFGLASAYRASGNVQQAALVWENILLEYERLGLVGPAVAIRRNLARLYRDQFEFEKSGAHLRKALDAVPKEAEDTRFELLDELRNVYFEMGQFARVEGTLQTINFVINDVQAIVNQIRELNDHVRLGLAVGTPQQAMLITHNIDGLVHKDLYWAATDKVQHALDVLAAQAVEQRAMLKSVLIEIEPSRQDFESARSRWYELGDSKAVKRCMLKKAELFLNAGDMYRASEVLEESKRLALDYDPENWLEENLISLGIFYFTDAKDLWKSTFETLYNPELKEKWKPHLRTRLQLRTGVWRRSVIKQTDANEFFTDLTIALREIKPVSARLLLLDPLSEYPSFRNLDYHVAEELLALVPLQRDDEDFNVYAPRLAELLRVLGRRDQAVSLLVDLIRNDQGQNSFALRRVFLTLGRTSARLGKMRELNSFLEKFLNDYKEFPVLCAATLVEIAELSYTMSSSERLRMLDQAEELLKMNAERSEWMARLFTLRGRLIIKEHRNEALDQLNRAIVIQEGLGNNLAVAKLKQVVVWEEREISRGGGSLSAKSPAARQQSPAQEQKAELTRSTATIHIEGNWTDSVTINATLPGEEVTTRRLPIEPASLLDQILAFDTYENYSFSFLRAMDDNWIATCYGLGQILMDDKQGRKLQTFSEKQRSSLRLIIDALQLSSAPWEMMVMPPPQTDTPASILPTLSFFYRSAGLPNANSFIDLAWADSDLSNLDNTRPLTRPVNSTLTKVMVKAFQRDHGLPDHGRLDGRTRRSLKRLMLQQKGAERPRVLLLRPSIERQRATSRGDDIIGFSLADWYAREGFRDIVTIEDPDVALLQAVLSNFAPDLVHICPAMEESTSIGIFLDFGTGGAGVPRTIKSGASRQQANVSSGEVQFLTLSALAELFRQQQKPDRARPLLILDVLQPAGRTELLTQLFLRNAFAAQIYETGAFESVIATGLTPPELREEMSRTLLSAIGNFESVGETVNRLRRLTDLGLYTRLSQVREVLGPLRDPADTGYLSKVVATAGTALFTPDPEF